MTKEINLDEFRRMLSNVASIDKLTKNTLVDTSRIGRLLSGKGLHFPSAEDIIELPELFKSRPWWDDRRYTYDEFYLYEDIDIMSAYVWLTTTVRRKWFCSDNSGLLRLTSLIGGDRKSNYLIGISLVTITKSLEPSLVLSAKQLAAGMIYRDIPLCNKGIYNCRAFFEKVGVLMVYD